MAFLESLVQREMGGRPAGTPQTAGLPAPAPATPAAPNPPAVGAGIGGGRPSSGTGPAPFSSPASPSPAAGIGAGGSGGTSPALPPAPASLPQSPGALPPSPSAPPAGAPQSAAAAPAALPYQVQLDRAPSPGDFVEHNGASFQTPYGIASRGPDGKVSYLFTPDGEARYQRDLATKHQRFGPLPSLLTTLPNLPKPNLTLEGSGYNPFSNQFVR